MLGLIGTILIFFYGISNLIAPKGEVVATFGVRHDKKIKNTRIKCLILSRLGLVLLMLSFLLQIIEAVK